MPGINGDHAIEGEASYGLRWRDGFLKAGDMKSMKGTKGMKKIKGDQRQRIERIKRIELIFPSEDRSHF